MEILSSILSFILILFLIALAICTLLLPFFVYCISNNVSKILKYLENKHL
jgi:hypothetical protein